MTTCTEQILKIITLSAIGEWSTFNAELDNALK